MAPAAFGPAGTVWASTVVRVALPERAAPYGLAYVDLDDGPRVLATVDGSTQAPIQVGSRVVLWPGPDDDLTVRSLEAAGPS